MDLVSEYYSRNLVETPLIRYVPCGNLILRRHDEANLEGKWEVLSIHFTNKDGAPGSFQIIRSFPKHNLYSASRAQMYVFSNQTVIWDLYEEHITELISFYKSKGTKAITEAEDLKIAFWEMYLLTYDSALSELSSAYLDIINQSMDYKSGSKKRYGCITDFFFFMNHNFDTVSSASIKLLSQGWNNMEAYVETYSFWLANILNK